MSVNSIEPLIKAAKEEEERVDSGSDGICTKTVKLKRGSSGYGMYLREALPSDKIECFVPTRQKPSTQLIIDCDEGGAAKAAGLQAGDFVIEVNNEDVRKRPHRELLALIGSLTEEVTLTVVHVPKFKVLSFEAKKFKSEEKRRIEGIPPPDMDNIPDTSVQSQEAASPVSKGVMQPASPSARRRRIKVLPNSESDDLRPEKVFEVAPGDDPNKADFKKEPQQPVRILPVDCDAMTIWEQAKRMQARRKSSQLPSEPSMDDSFLPEHAPDRRDSEEVFQSIKDHPYKWDVYQTSVWVKSFGLMEVAQIFEYNEIRGEHLKYISKNDLRDIDITDEAVLSKLAEEIEKLLCKYESGGRV